LIRQYRYAAGGYIWELPAGILESANETPVACAERELREETGLSAREWRPLGSIMTTPGFTDERIHLFLARGARTGKARARPRRGDRRKYARCPLATRSR
jgi:ADP-ribose pyrophosphatase